MMSTFATLVFFLASFLLGAFTALIAAVAVTYYYLSLLNSSKTDAVSRTTAAREGQGTTGSSAEHQATKVVDGVGAEEKSLGGYAKFLTPAQHALSSRDSFPMMLGRSSGVLRSIGWQYAVIRGNMLFKYKDKGTNVAQVVCLNGCMVEATSNNWSKKDTAIKLSHSDYELFGDGHSVMYLFFPNGREFELWFYALQRGSKLSTNLAKYQVEDSRVHSYFTQYHNILTAPDTPNDSAWCNAILARFWWNFQGSRGFNSFLSQGLCQRITKMTDFPGFIESMVLEKMSLGTSLPMVSNATLYSITDEGAVIVDMDVVYHTGFEMTIGIMTSLQLPGASVKVPASASMQIKRLSGRMRMQINPPPCDRFWIGFHENPTFDINAETSIASDSILPNMVQLANSIMKKMDITNLIVNKLQGHIINETMVLPNMDEWPMPYWPESYDPPEGEDGRPHLIYQRVDKGEPSMQKTKSLLKALSFIDISPDGISVLGTPWVRSAQEKEERKREKEEREREKQQLRGKRRELKLLSSSEGPTAVIEPPSVAVAASEEMERERERERERSPSPDRGPLMVASHRRTPTDEMCVLSTSDAGFALSSKFTLKEKEREREREREREKDGKRWSLPGLRRSHEKHNKDKEL